MGGDLLGHRCPGKIRRQRVHGGREEQRDDIVHRAERRGHGHLCGHVGTGAREGGRGRGGRDCERGGLARREGTVPEPGRGREEPGGGERRVAGAPGTVEAGTAGTRDAGSNRENVSGRRERTRAVDDGGAGGAREDGGRGRARPAGGRRRRQDTRRLRSHRRRQRGPERRVALVGPPGVALSEDRPGGDR